MPKQKAKAPTEHDRFIGDRIREARIAIGMSQEQLAELIGVSFQQVQKYETGHNRINGARIGLLVTALNHPFNYFFPNVTDIRAAPTLSHFLATKDGQKLASLFPRLSPASRSAVITLINVMAREQL